VADPLDRPPTGHVPLPPLDPIVESAADAVIATDHEQRVTAWNRAAEQLYGIAAADALGRPFPELLDVSTLGRKTDPEAIRREAATAGSWHGRSVQRPRVGSRVGRMIVAEVTVSPVRGPDGAIRGFMGINRDITTSARLAERLTALGNLATGGQPVRSEEQVATAALEIVTEATGAESGLIARFDGDRFVPLAGHNMSDQLREIVERSTVHDSQFLPVLAARDALVSADLDSTPIRPETREAIRSVGIRSIALVGLHEEGRLVGLLGLGWGPDVSHRPSDDVLLQAAGSISAALANARLVERLAGAARSERGILDQLSALQDLASVDPGVVTVADLAERIVSRLREATAARAGSFALYDVDADRLRFVHQEGFDPRIIDHIAAQPANERLSIPPLRGGMGAFVMRYDEPAVDPTIRALATELGMETFAILPLRVDGELRGVISLDLPEHHDPGSLVRFLEPVARLASVALANLLLRERASASEQRYRTLFEESPDAYILSDESMRILEANPAAARLFGLDPAAMPGRSLSESLDSPTETAETDPTGTVRRSAWSFRGSAIRADGARFAASVEATPVVLDGETRLLLLLHGLTDEERLQRELVQAQKMEAVGQLVSGVAHELNNPLAAIIAFSQLIRRDPRLPEELHRDADLLVQEADRTRRIVNNLLDFARQRPPRRVATNLGALIRRVVELQAYSLSSAGVTVETEVPDDLPPVEVDQQQFLQVILNLTLNAIQSIRSTKAPGSIRIVATGADETVRLSVSDDGPGIPEADRARLFLPFFTTKEPGEGTGLGLSVSFGIVAAHGGRLWHEPGPDGRGATFTVELPVGRAIEPATAPARGRRAPGRRRAARGERPSVLVVDDEPSIRAFLVRVLRGAGFEPIAVPDGDSAIRALRRRSFSAVLCDHRMAGLSGVEVYEATARIHPELAPAFVFMSGDVLNSELREFTARQGIALLAKPFDIDVVGRVVHEVVGRTERATRGR
jgi:PAS domain S-box-containing protein